MFAGTTQSALQKVGLPGKHESWIPCLVNMKLLGIIGNYTVIFPYFDGISESKGFLEDGESISEITRSKRGFWKIVDYLALGEAWRRKESSIGGDQGDQRKSLKITFIPFEFAFLFQNFMMNFILIHCILLNTKPFIEQAFAVKV